MKNAADPVTLHDWCAELVDALAVSTEGYHLVDKHEPHKADGWMECAGSNICKRAVRLVQMAHLAEPPT